MFCIWLKMIWLHLAALRFMLCILPQTGLVSKREFEESSEKMAGDVFGLFTNHPVHFDSSLPKDSVLYPMASSGLPFLLLKYFSQFNFNFVTPYTLLILPRIFMTAQSLIVDTLIYKTCLICYDNPETAHYACIIFASSCISWIFCSRTLLATYELIFVAAILYFCVDKKYSHSRSILLSCIAAVAMYLDAESSLIICLPLFFWIFKHWGTVNIFTNLSSLMFGTVITWTWLFLADCLYTVPGFLQGLNDTEMRPSSILKWVNKLPWTPPYNWFKSVEDKSFINLHSSTILTVSLVPLLIFLIFARVLRLPVKFAQNAKGSMKMMQLLVIASLLYVFLFRIQNELFLLPLAFPLIVLSSTHVHHFKSMKFCTTVWVLYNVVAFLVFGMMHQGGMLPCMNNLHSVISTHNELLHLATRNTEMHILFYRTSIPPAHLLNWPKKEFSKKGLVVQLHNAQEPHFAYKLIELALKSQSSVLYLVTPASMPCKEKSLLHDKYHMELYFEFHPHLTFFNPALQNNQACYKGDAPISNFLQSMALNIYRIGLNDVQHTIQYKSFKE